MIEIGIIGCGKIAQIRHLPEYAANKDAHIAGIFDLSNSRAQEVAKVYQTKAYATYKELLEDPKIEAVSICTSNATHYEMTVEALRAGKHVLCEKPMAVTLEQCSSMVKVAEETNKYLMIGHNQRLAKAHTHAKELIEKGEIGKILTFRTSFGHSGPETWIIDEKNNWFFDKKSAAFGAMADLGIHKTDLIQYLTGQKVSEVSAYIGTLDKKDSNEDLISVDDNAICIYKMDGGCVGTMTASWTYYGSEDNSTTLYGTKGIMHLYENPEYSIVIKKRDGTQIFYKEENIQTNSNQTKSGIIDLWVDCLKEQKEPEISGKEVLHAMKVIFAAEEAARTGKTVLIE